jgi:peptidoglycan/xylan/chitin deacetylase (PgdA/CDA1 family)
MLRSVLGLLSPSGNRARLSILIFHRVLADPDPLFPGEVCARQFDDICSWVKQWFNVLPLNEAAARLRAGTLPARCAAITFDDGYADNQTIALPILRRHGLTATFFVATGFLDGGLMWNDGVVEAIKGCKDKSLNLGGFGLSGLEHVDISSVPMRRLAINSLISAIKYRPQVERKNMVESLATLTRAKLPSDLMMRSDQVLSLHRAGMQIGAHTATHPILATLEPDAILKEIATSKQTLEQIISQAVTLFAYPNGKPGRDYTEASVAAARALGFEAAVSTAWGAARAGADSLQLPRFSPWDRTRTRFGLRMARNLLNSARA